MMERPPCWPEGQRCPNDCAKQLHDRVIHNQTSLWGDWAGFRMAGRELVAPDGQRISVQRMKGLLWRDSMELRRAGFASRQRAERGTGAKIKVVVVDLQDYRENGLTAA